MSLDIVPAWVEELLKQCARWNIIFIQLGEAYPSARRAIEPRMDDVISAVDYIAQPHREGKLRLVTDLEELSTAGAPTLGQLRDRVNSDRDAGGRVILLSRRPRSAFPTVPGSQVLLDAKLVTPPIYQVGASWRFGYELTQDGTPSDVVVETALRELGEVACAELDASIFEDGRDSRSLTSMSEQLQDALLGAGMITGSHHELEWCVADAQAVIRNALADVIAGMRRPQDALARVSEGCWVIERMVRQSLRARARALWGNNWSTELLGQDLAETAFRRALAGTYPSAEKLEDLRDPLEWLTLSETFSLLKNPALGSLGVNPSMWTLMSTELLPVKDRVERSQLMRKADIDTVHRWTDLLRQRLSMSGSRSPEETFALATTTQQDLLRTLRTDLAENPEFRGDVDKDVMSLVTATVRFLAHCLEERPSFTAAFSKEAAAPLERELQDGFKSHLDMSDLAGRSAIEVSGVAGGRADVVLYFNDGARYVTEVKRELSRATRDALETAFLSQTVAYQSANLPFGQLLVLDLTRDRDVGLERLDESIWIAHNKSDDGVVVASTVVAVVRGNRPTPSRRRK
jgi:hypothetical protein